MLRLEALCRRRLKSGPAALVAEQQQQKSMSSVSELEDDLEDSDSGEEDEPEILEPPSPGAPCKGPAACPAKVTQLGGHQDSIRAAWSWQ